MVKHTFRSLQAAGIVGIRTKRPVVPSEARSIGTRGPGARSWGGRAAGLTGDEAGYERRSIRRCSIKKITNNPIVRRS